MFQTVFELAGEIAVGLVIILTIAVIIERRLAEPKRRQEAAERLKHQIKVQQYKALLAIMESEPPPHLHLSFGSIENFLLQDPQGPSPYVAADLLGYKRDCFEFTQKYLRNGDNCFDEIASALIREKPNWIRFLVDYNDGGTWDGGGRWNHRLRHLRNSNADQYAVSQLVLSLIVGFASQYCRDHHILTMPDPKPGSADAGSFGHAFIRLVAEAKAGGVLIAGDGI